MKGKTRLAVIVSHPVQYYVPLYQRLAKREDIELKVFYTWHAGDAAVPDHGFKQAVAWDIPLAQGYQSELVPNVAADPGTHHFFGLRNPSLVSRVMGWRPDVVHITGWAWLSHLLALRALHRRGVKTMFRGDSHLLDSSRSGPQWWLKRTLLSRIYRWPTVFPFVGSANRAYYEAFGVGSDRLFLCPHSIDVARFAGREEGFDSEAAEWRRTLGIRDHEVVLLFAGKFERKKRPVELMRAVQSHGAPGLVLVLAGGGELEGEVLAIAASDPARFRVLPFQNQSRMPVVYRLGDIFVLPSAFDETWGMAVNEAMACGRPVVVSDRVGCAADVIDETCGRVFPWEDFSAMIDAVNTLSGHRQELAEMGRSAALRACSFDVARTESALVQCLTRLPPA